MILIDLSQIYFTNVNSSFFREQLEKQEYTVEELLRNMTFNGLLEVKKKFSDYATNPDEIYICCDDTKHYWRRDIFPHYKVKRKAMRKDMTDKYSIDWELVYKVFDEIKTAIRDNFRYRMIEVDGCEADDIIATYVFNNQDKKILIYSSDGDFKQLLRFGNVKQFSPIKKEFINLTEQQIIAEYVAKLVKGDSKDSIPNILSHDNIFVDLDENGKAERQKPITKQVLAKFVSMGEQACENEEQRKNYRRNASLIDFREIPQEIKDRITTEINTFIPKGDMNSVFNYLTEKRMSNFQKDIAYF